MNTRALLVPMVVRRAMVAHAVRESPRECCGFLLGRHRRVAYSVEATNVAAGTTRYRVDDVEHIRLRKLLRAFAPSLEIVGVYHSHPAGSAMASVTDAAESMYPDWFYVIVGLKSPRRPLRAYRFSNGSARELALR
jgi:proteasome lid subunit RPN8/RPN11